MTDSRPDIENFTTAGLAQWRAALNRYVTMGEVPGLVSLLCRRGETHVHVAGGMEVGGPPMARDTIFRIASMTKPVAAVAAMILVESGNLQLDGPVDGLLPELANRRVLKRLDGALDDTVPARRAITTRDLLTLRMGLGHIMARTDGHPIQEAINAAGVLHGWPAPQRPPEPNRWMAQVGALPLMYQPGDQWMYDLGLDVLGVLIARAANKPLDVFLQEHIFAPLGMVDTGFAVPPEKRHRLATAYQTGLGGGGLDVYDGVGESQWGRPPAFPAAASGLVSTADDYARFLQMLLEKGGALLSEDSVVLMTRDHLTSAQRNSPGCFLDPASGWGFGMAVNIGGGAAWERPGRFGWDGGLGTSAYADPEAGLFAILLTQRVMDSPEAPPLFRDFWTSAYAALAPNVAGEEDPKDLKDLKDLKDNNNA